MPLAGGTMTGSIASTGSPSITMGKGSFGTSNSNTGTDAFAAGTSNKADADYAFAAGRAAEALDTGAFVWADSGSTAFSSAAADTFNVLASGGIWLGSSGTSGSIGSGRFIDTSTGAHLTTGGTWTNSSDAALKQDFAPVDTVDVLRRLLELPITTWSYRAEGPDVVRMGPTAQDFHALFGLGQSERSISTVDADGVAMAAVQGLHALLVQRDATVLAQQARIDALERRTEELLARLTALESKEDEP